MYVDTLHRRRRRRQRGSVRDLRVAVCTSHKIIRAYRHSASLCQRRCNKSPLLLTVGRTTSDLGPQANGATVYAVRQYAHLRSVHRRQQMVQHDRRRVGVAGHYLKRNHIPVYLSVYSSKRGFVALDTVR